MLVSTQGVNAGCQRRVSTQGVNAGCQHTVSTQVIMQGINAGCQRRVSTQDANAGCQRRVSTPCALWLWLKVWIFLTELSCYTLVGNLFAALAKYDKTRRSSFSTIFCFGSICGIFLLVLSFMSNFILVIISCKEYENTFYFHFYSCDRCYWVPDRYWIPSTSTSDNNAAICRDDNLSYHFICNNRKTWYSHW